MLIPVIYSDYTHDMVESYLLASLIREGKIRSFKRASGWVQIGKDRVRKYDDAGRVERCGFEYYSKGKYVLQLIAEM